MPSPTGPTGPTLRDVWAGLGARGRLREVYAGDDATLDPVALRSVLEEVDASGDVGTTLAVCVQLASAVPLLAAGARHDGALRELHAAVLAGQRTLALAATDDAASGSELARLGTTATEDRTGTWRVDGGKRWVTNGWADDVLVLARTRPGEHFTCFTWLLVEGRDVTREPATDTLAGAGLAHLRLDGVVVPASRQVGRRGRAMVDFAVHVTRERLAGAIWATALCRRVIDETAVRLQSRPAGEGTQWDLPTVRRALAERVVEVEALDALVRAREAEIVAGFAPAAAATVKVAAARAVSRAVDTCAELHGADGYAPGGLQQLRGDAALFGIGGGVLDVVLEDVIAGHGPGARGRAA